MHRRIPELDGLRGIAILLALILHFGVVLSPATMLDASIRSVVLPGWCGLFLRSVKTSKATSLHSAIGAE